MEGSRTSLNKDLYLASQDGDVEKVKEYLERGADPKWTGGAGLSPLHGAGLTNKPEVVKHLVKYGADVNQQTVFGYTPLHLACMWGHMEVIKEFLENDQCDIELTTKEGTTALDEAKKNIEFTGDVVQHIEEYEDRRSKQVASFKRAIRSGESQIQTIMHVCFQGTARSGKTSLCKVLTEEKADPLEPSTGAAVKPARVEIRQSTVRAALSSSWMTVKELQEEADLLVQEAYTKAPPELKDATKGDMYISHGSSETEALSTASLQSTSHSSCSCSPAMLPNYPNRRKVDRMIKVAVARASQKLDQQCDPWTIYLSDIGGQLEFQEVVPALTNGPSVHIIVIKATTDLSSGVNVIYTKHRGESTHLYTTTYSAKDILLQNLSTIMSISCEEHQPQAIIVLTHKEKVSTEALSKLDKELQKSVADTKAFKEGVVVFASETRMCHAINNLDPDPVDVKDIRSTIERIAKQNKSYRVKVPHRWMLFGIALREVKMKALSYEDCITIGTECGLNIQDELDDALKFLGSKLGIIRYFDQIPLLRNIVITDPQILFDNVSRLIVNTFTFDKVNPSTSQDFKSKGIFPVETIDQISTDSKLLTTDRFIAFLEYFQIIVRITVDGRPVYFVPCSLVHADSNSETQNPPDATSLLFVFKCGYTPRGVFGFLVADLLTNKLSDKFDFTLDQQHGFNSIFRDQITFSVGPYRDKCRLLVSPCYIKVDVWSMLQDRKILLKDICCFVHERIRSSLTTIADRLNYRMLSGFSPAFLCTKCTSNVHPAVVTTQEPMAMECTVTKDVMNLPEDSANWFDKDGAFLEEGTGSDDHLNEADHLPWLMNTLWEIRTSWKNLGVQLGIDMAQLTAIEQNSGKTEDCFRELLSYLLKMEPTKFSIATAVKSPTIDAPKLASKLLSPEKSTDIPESKRRRTN